jgi:hypothetical protein
VWLLWLSPFQSQVEASMRNTLRARFVEISGKEDDCKRLEDGIASMRCSELPELERQVWLQQRLRCGCASCPTMFVGGSARHCKPPLRRWMRAQRRSTTAQWRCGPRRSICERSASD